MENNTSPADQNSLNFIETYAQEILVDLGQTNQEGEQYQKLLKLVSDRITARVFLETIGMLKPEQAAELAAEIGDEKVESEEKLRSVISKIPDYESRMAQVLVRIRAELLEDLKPLV